MTIHRTVTVFGAYGHTGRFVVSELLARRWTPILAGRDVDKLAKLGDEYDGLKVRAASVDSAASLDGALHGAVAVINCAGPFIDTAAPVIEAALRAHVHYFDVTAEQRAILSVFERFDGLARDAGIVIAPAMAFFGGLADLLATVAMGDWQSADAIQVAYALDSWHPTLGTRLTGKRNTERRFVFSNNKLEFAADPPSNRTWEFPAPFGVQEVTPLCLSEIVTISRHLRVAEVRAFMNLPPMRDLHDPETPAPTAADESGRSSQTFLVEVVARKGRERRRAFARGRDIYAITGPIVVEAVQRVVTAQVTRTGVITAGKAFHARDFLGSLSPVHLSLEIQPSEVEDRTNV
jgi:NAD(P)-dependent dehydrogenase (short-subunit alcohol dehydrogenase family)